MEIKKVTRAETWDLTILLYQGRYIESLDV